MEYDQNYLRHGPKGVEVSDENLFLQIDERKNDGYQTIDKVLSILEMASNEAVNQSYHIPMRNASDEALINVPPRIHIPQNNNYQNSMDVHLNSTEKNYPDSAIHSTSSLGLMSPDFVSGPQMNQQKPSPILTNSASAKRPSNSWILYRREKHPQILAKRPDISNNDISKVAAEMWKNENEETKQKYKLRAQIERNKHKLLYPDYKYAPRKKKPGRNRSGSKNVQQPQMLPSGNHVGNSSEQAERMQLMIRPWVHNDCRQMVRPIIPLQSPRCMIKQQAQSAGNVPNVDYLFNPYISPLTEHQDQKNMRYMYVPQLMPGPQLQCPTPNDICPQSPYAQDIVKSQVYLHPEPQAGDSLKNYSKGTKYSDDDTR